MDSSDEEIFMGKVMPSELKRHIQLFRRTMSVITVSDDSDASGDSRLGLIEARSEPELEQSSAKSPSRCRRSSSEPKLRDSMAPSSWESKITEESFVAMESLISSTSENSEELMMFNQLLEAERQENLCHSHDHDAEVRDVKKVTTPNNEKKLLMGNATANSAIKNCQNQFKTPLAPEKVQKVHKSEQKVTPFRSPLHKSSSFKNIESPVRFYIRNSPQAHLVTTVKPKRPLPTFSAIPKPIHANKADKENVVQDLPAKAYVGAKQIKMIVTPNSKHLPKNNQVKKMAQLLPQPTVIRHARREKNPLSRIHLPTPDESFAKLSVSQADLSVHVEKTAAVSDTLKRKC